MTYQCNSHQEIVEGTLGPPMRHELIRRRGK
jgi:hypothetical protein